MISLEKARDLIQNNNIQLIDIRGESEFRAGHIKGADNLFLGTLPQHLDKVSKDKQVVIHCQSGDRAAIGYSILARNGFKNIANFSGGMKEWINSGEPVVS